MSSVPDSVLLGLRVWLCETALGGKARVKEYSIPSEN